MMKKVSLLLVLLLLSNLGLGAIMGLAASSCSTLKLKAEAVSGTEIKLTWTDESDNETGL